LIKFKQKLNKLSNNKNLWNNGLKKSKLFVGELHLLTEGGIPWKIC
jgi:hypothetical protein